jgi:isocitrate dehydrogenase kinase/phosphatase
MSQTLTTDNLVNRTAHAINQAFGVYQKRYAAITQRAGTRFAQRDWRGMQADARERLDLYKKVVDETVAFGSLQRPFLIQLLEGYLPLLG